MEPRTKELRFSHRHRAAALVIVLAFLVIITVMAVAFFSTVANEAASSRALSDALAARQLADSTTQYVVGQIRQATTVGTTNAWASQPGMIRTFGADGKAKRVYKLYSSPLMAEDVNGSFDPGKDLPPDSWRDDRALWADLNAPAASPQGRTVFPIVDPRAAAPPSGATAPLVEGFSFDAAKVAGTVAPSSTADAAARLPLPVRWLYQLRDGRFTSPSGGSAGRADFSGSDPRPTADNPIVGRVAFWTDDETCKLNLNTAAGGNVWDVPSYTAGIELHFSRYKPVKEEFARYPGHPATTSLSPVLWSFAGLSSPDVSLFPALNPSLVGGFYYLNRPVNTAAAVAEADVHPSLSPLAEGFFQKALQLSPRNTWGGSEMGSRATVVGRNETLNPQVPDRDRLFASVDEILYGMSVAAGQRPENAFSLHPDDVEKLRFFLTSHSRSPDTNPLNQPRVGIWPVPENPARRTPVDKLIAFCLTLNDAEYFFTRKNPDSPTDDFRPGSRNEEVFDYLDQGLAAPVPGFGGSLGDRYGSKGVRRILTQIFDYIRGSVNLTDTFDAQYVSRFQVNAPYAFVPPRVGLGERGKGQVIPIRIAKNGEVYKGHGRFVTIKEAGLQIFAVAANQPPVLVDPATGIPTTAINPMHPWTANPPASATVTDKGDGTWTISAANAYPAIGGQSHAGLPFLPGIWPADPAVLTDPVRRAGVINPRYQGPATIWSGSPGGLPQPAPKTAANVLGPHETLIQAAFLVDPVVVNPGTPPYNGRYQVVVRGLDQFRADGKPMGFPSVVIQTPASMDTVDYGPGYYTISTHNRTTGALSGAGRYQERLTFVSAPVAVGPGTDHGATFAFSGGTITVELRTEPAANDPTAPGNLGELVQSAEIEFPASTFPTPLLAPMPVQGANSSQGLLVTGNDVSTAYKNTGVPSDIRDLTPSTLLTFDAASTLALNPNFGVGTAIFQNGRTRTRYGTGAGGDLFAQNFFLPERMTDPATDPKAKLTADTIRMVELLYGDARVAGTQAALDASFFRPHVFYHDSSMRPAHTLRSGYGSSTATNFRGTTDHPLSDAGLSNPSFAYTPLHSAGAVNNFRGVPAGADPKIRSLGAQLSTNAGSEAQFIVSGAPHATSSVDFQAADFAAVWAQGGDYDTGPGLTLDGPFIGKAVEGGEMLRHLTEAYDGRNTNPDFNLETFEFSLENTNNSPNRQISSAVMFGSLATGGSPQDSWRTLLFSPNPNVQGHPSLAEVPAAGSIPAAGRAPDYLLLDFFSMPVVEPYAISEPFSTAGRVNMNAQLAPFTHIRRDTALRGVLRTALVSAVEDSRVQNRKVRGFQGRYSDGPGGTYTQFLQNSGHWAFRYPVHPGETLRQFEQRFANGDLFRSPSEICSLWLYPARQPTAAAPQNPASPVVAWDAASANIRRWWYDNPGGTRKSVTSDNMRERPYAAVYPRLTTKSNTYTAYVKVQVLQKVPGTRPDEWVENRDRVRGEYRGSSMIERYIDAADPALPDFAAPDQAGTSLDDFYRYRTLNTKRFQP